MAYLLYLDSTIGKEVVKRVVAWLSFVGLVLPHDVEGQDLAVVRNEALKISVRVTTAEFYLVVFADLSCVFRGLLVVDH